MQMRKKLRKSCDTKHEFGCDGKIAWEHVWEDRVDVCVKAKLDTGETQDTASS